MFGRNKPPKREEYNDILDENIEGFSTEEVEDATLNGQSLVDYVSGHGKPGIIYSNSGRSLIKIDGQVREVTAQLERQGK